MRIESFKSRLKRGDSQFGVFNTLGDLNIAEMISYAGFDFQIVDLEHGPFRPDTLSIVDAVIKATQKQCSLICRIPEPDAPVILQMLDQGIKNIMVAHIETPEQIQSVIDAMYFPPRGRRSYSPYTRNGKYGLLTDKEIIKSTEEYSLSIIIETLKGIEALPDLLRAFSEYIDVVYFGAYDLSKDMGIEDGLKSNPLWEVIRRGADACIEEKTGFGGYVTKDKDSVEKLKSIGSSFFTCCVDSDLIQTSLVNQLKQFRAGEVS